MSKKTAVCGNYEQATLRFKLRLHCLCLGWTNGALFWIFMRHLSHCTYTMLSVLYRNHWCSSRLYEKQCSNRLSFSLCVLSHPCNHHLFVHIVWSSASGPCGLPPDASFGLVLAVFLVCGLALLGLITLVSWKLCWVPWRSKAQFPSPSLSPTCGPQHCPLQPSFPLPSPQQPVVTMATEKVKDPMGSMGFLEAAVKISHTSPDIPADVQLSMREHFLRRTQRMQRQTTEPASSTRFVTHVHANAYLITYSFHVFRCRMQNSQNAL